MHTKDDTRFPPRFSITLEKSRHALVFQLVFSSEKNREEVRNSAIVNKNQICVAFLQNNCFFSLLQKFEFYLKFIYIYVLLMIYII